MPICAIRKKNVLKNTLLSMRFQRRYRPQKVDQSQRSQPIPIQPKYMHIIIYLQVYIWNVLPLGTTNICVNI